MREQRPSVPAVWVAALGNFVLAAATGALFRWGTLHGLPWGLSFVRVRHAHSHLMYFGWVTPTLMLLMAASLPQDKRPRFHRLAGVTVLLGLLAYVPFLLFGYDPVPLGAARVPLATVAASLNMLAWYAFAWAYVHARRGFARSMARSLWDAAIASLVLASLGAWGRALLVALKLQDPFWETALVEWFLVLFSDGWLVLGVLAAAYAGLDPVPRAARWATIGVVLGLAPSALLGVPASLTPFRWRVVAGVGAAMVGMGLLTHVCVLWPRRGLWRLALAFLGVKALAELAAAWPGVAAWAEAQALRIPYLHVELLGFVTLGLIVAAHTTWHPTAERWVRLWAWAVGAVVASLIPLTGLWPPAWRGPWTSEVAWATALFAVVVGMLYTGEVAVRVLGGSRKTLAPREEIR